MIDAEKCEVVEVDDNSFAGNYYKLLTFCLFLSIFFLFFRLVVIEHVQNAMILCERHFIV